MTTTLQERMQLALEHRKRLAGAGSATITQKSLAVACGVKPPSVNAWFSGETKSLKGETVVKAARYLAVRPDWLASDRGPMLESHIQAVDTHNPSTPGQASAQAASRPSVQEVVRLWGALLAAVPEEKRREVVELAQTYAVAPDSDRIARRLIELLSVADLKLPSWRQAAVTVAAKMSDEGKALPGKVLVPTIDEFFEAQLRELVPRAAQSKVKES